MKMKSYCVLIETNYKTKKKLPAEEKQAAKHLGYTPSRWKKLSVETRIRKLLQDIFDADDSGVHVLNVMKADVETKEIHKAG